MNIQPLEQDNDRWGQRLRRKKSGAGKGGEEWEAPEGFWEEASLPGQPKLSGEPGIPCASFACNPHETSPGFHLLSPEGKARDRQSHCR